MEIELKYKIGSLELYDRILNDVWIRRYAEEGGTEAVRMKAAYFDTEDRVLTNNNIALRIRSENDHIVGTLKWRDDDEGIRGLYIRSEINVPVADETCFFSPDPQIFMQSAEGRDLLDVIDGKPLENIFDMIFTRRRIRLDYGQSIMELSLDEGAIVAGMRSLPLLEAEIELFSGTKEDLISFGKKIAGRYSLEPELKTKFARGVELLGLEEEQQQAEADSQEKGGHS
ncbi:MAG: CYTH domain-containing protein [Clostridiales Family XIII bacterium]|jgi:triphosphatase|nr:CYTH domain-containing protein [Clostridiales Family XIII bacterium]